MFQIRKAERQKAKLRIGVAGPSGSGKTYSSLLLAKGVMGSLNKVVIIDTENGSADLYSHLGEYNVIRLQAPYSPERYTEAIKACIDAGMELIIVDSVTHEWDGKGGCLEINELLAKTKFKGNTWSAWSETTPRHQKFIEAITTSPVHMIVTTRSKTDTVMTDDKKVKKLGMKEIQREGFEYELTINFTLDRDGHFSSTSKDRTGIFIDQDPFVITEKTGEILRDWAESGVDPLPPEEKKPVAPAKAPAKPVDPVVKLKTEINNYLKKLGHEVKTKEEAEAKVLEITQLELVEANFDEIAGRLSIILQEQNNEERN